MTTAQALDALRTNPDYFLQYYPLSVQVEARNLTMGLSPDAYDALHQPNVQRNGARVMTLYMKKAGEEVGHPARFNSHLGATRPGRILSFITHRISSFVITDDPAETPLTKYAEPFEANVIPMTLYAPGMEGAIPGHRLDNGVGFMITGVLSGCCFCWTQSGGNIYCAHFKPTPGVYSGNLIQTNVQAQGSGFRGLPQPRVKTFGINDFDPTVRQTLIIGIRSKGVWSFYAQGSMRGQNRRSITGVRRINLNRNQTRLR